MIKTHSLPKGFTAFAVICVLEVEKKVKLSIAQSCLFVTPWTIEPTRLLLCPWNSPGKNTGVGICVLEIIHIYLSVGFSGGSDSQESACNAGDLGWIPESRRSPGEGSVGGNL